MFSFNPWGIIHVLRLHSQLEAYRRELHTRGMTVLEVDAQIEQAYQSLQTNAHLQRIPNAHQEVESEPSELNETQRKLQQILSADHKLDAKLSDLLAEQQREAEKVRQGMRVHDEP